MTLQPRSRPETARGSSVNNVLLTACRSTPRTTYNVAVNNFLADGGDNFDTFALVDPNDRVPGAQDIDALIDYFEANSPVAAPGTDRVNEIPFHVTPTSWRATDLDGLTSPS